MCGISTVLLNHIQCIYRVSLKSLRVNNRMVLIVSLVMSLFGSMMATDWQAIGQDPCHIQFTNASISSTGDSNSSSFVDGTTLHLVNTSDFSSEEIDSPMYNISDFADICTAGTSDIHECYWNPNSRVTGILCSLCRPVCRAESMSIAFVQFSLGVGLISMAAQLMEMALLGIATDCTATSAHVSYEPLSSEDIYHPGPLSQQLSMYQSESQLSLYMIAQYKDQSLCTYKYCKA